MKKLVLLPILVLLIRPGHTQNNDFFGNADVFFKTFVDDQGRVDYAKIKSNLNGLHFVMGSLELYSLKNADANTQKAYWINAYNLIMIKSIVENYPIKKPTDVKGIFENANYKAGGKMVSLDMIENKILRPTYKDARLHFVLVCGAVGCPKLANFAYRPETLESQLITRTKKAMNDPSFIKTDKSGENVQISSIFDWYKDDFLKEAPSFHEYINRYKDNPISSKAILTFYPYNWNLNDKNASSGFKTKPARKEKSLVPEKETKTSAIPFVKSVFGA